MSKLMRVAALAAFLAMPFAVQAEQPAPAEAAMPCPHADNEGGCCGGACAEMQAKAAAGAPAQADEGGCPCQRAARAAAAAKAAEQRQAQP
jgi:hypothetical protein